MPDEFKLRPFDEHSGDCVPDIFNRGHNNIAEAQARALAAAIIEVFDRRREAYMEDGNLPDADVVRCCINDIHRLVPPKENVVQ